ncbi:MAG TPA: hypothetical protein V6C57_14165, partial [Coleofasciculaceae cyanobacterium]
RVSRSTGMSFKSVSVSRTLDVVILIEFLLREVAIDLASMADSSKGYGIVFNEETDAVVAHSNSIGSIVSFDFLKVRNLVDAAGGNFCKR